MSKLDVMKVPDGEAYVFHCPGCKCGHVFYCGTGPGPRWSFDGDMDKPTFSPSLLNRLPPEVIARREAKAVDPRYIRTLPADVCHLFVTSGKIQFLGDCTHELAGQTVAMEDIE